MNIQSLKKMPQLSQIRRMEAVSFRSFPATSCVFDGTWAVRLTAGHPAKRLNSVNPLDPCDNSRLEERIHMANQRFKSFGRSLVFRLTPLAPAGLKELLQESGWTPFEESIVMIADISKFELENTIDQVPLKDTGSWIDDYIKLSKYKLEVKPGLAEIIGATEPETGLFVHSNKEGVPASVLRCVHDRDVAGVFDLVTNQDMLREGHGTRIMQTGLLWASKKGASSAWLQVKSASEPAIALYKSMGFSELYRYTYWKPPVGDAPLNFSAA
ncbi:MAG: GNAT family N-acetyltransferase [Nitratireductor sp.]